VGDCWIGLSLANTNWIDFGSTGGKHTDKLIGLSVTTRGKKPIGAGKRDDWGGYGGATGNIAPSVGSDPAVEAHQY